MTQSPKSLIERLEAIIADAQADHDFDASQAFDGDRPDLWDIEPEVPLGWLIEAVQAIRSAEEENAKLRAALANSQPRKLGQRW